MKGAEEPVLADAGATAPTWCAGEAPVIAFLIPLRPEQGCRDWPGTLRLLHQTLGSLIAQTDGRWRAVVVGTATTGTLLPADPRISLHALPYLPPCSPSVPLCNHDRTWKVRYAGVVAHTLAPQYTMPLDADDLLHRDLVATVAAQPHPVGYVLDQGYELHDRLQRYRHHYQLSQVCSSTFIFNEATFPSPRTYDWASLEPCQHLRHGHQTMKAMAAERGLTFAPFPKPGLLYLRGLRHSNSTFRLRRSAWRRALPDLNFWLRGHPLTAQLAADFSIIHQSR